MKLAPLALALALLGACSSPATGNQVTASGGQSASGGSAAGGPGGSPPLTMVVTVTDLAVGPNHFAFAVLDERNQPLDEPALPVTFYDLRGAEAAPIGSVEAILRRPLSEWNRGVYKADVTFEQPGPYGVEATVTGTDGSTRPVRTRFDVKAESAMPALGGPAPRSRNLVVGDAVDPIELCTATAEICAATDGLRRLRIADVAGQGKPLVVLFATPGFCTSQTCGPQLSVFESVAERYRDRANFVHVEIYKDPQARQPNATVVEWGLPSEPWTFLVDANGQIADKFEAITAPEEIEAALQRLLS